MQSILCYTTGGRDLAGQSKACRKQLPGGLLTKQETRTCRQLWDQHFQLSCRRRTRVFSTSYLLGASATHITLLVAANLVIGRNTEALAHIDEIIASIQELTYSIWSDIRSCRLDSLVVERDPGSWVLLGLLSVLLARISW